MVVILLGPVWFAPRGGKNEKIQRGKEVDPEKGTKRREDLFGKVFYAP